VSYDRRSRTFSICVYHVQPAPSFVQKVNDVVERPASCLLFILESIRVERREQKKTRLVKEVIIRIVDFCELINFEF